MARQPTIKKPAAKRPARARKAGAAPPPADNGKPAGGKRAKPDPAPARVPLSLPGVGAASTSLRTVTLNFAFVAAFVLLVPVLVSQFWRSEVLIDRIPVPAALAELGLTPEVAASRLWDGLRDATASARTSKASLTAIPDSQRVQFTLPESGFSMDSLIQQTRQFFNAYQTRIGGEFTCADVSCDRSGIRLRLRVITDHARIVEMAPLGDTPLRDYFTSAAVQILSILDPFVAIAAVQDAQPTRAMVLARNLVRQNHPDAKWAYNLVGNLKTDDIEGAIAAYEAALSIDPRFVIARSNLAAHLVMAGRLEEARGHYDILAREAQDDLLVLTGLVQFALVDGRLDDAETLATKGAALAPRDPYYIAKLGEVWQARGDAEKAREQYERALLMDPSFVPALGALGVHYLSTGDLQSAELLYADFVEYAPGDLDANLMYARLLSARGENDLALDHYARSLEIAPDDPVVLTETANLLVGMGRTDEAASYLRRALALEPENAAAHAQLGRLLMMKSDFPGAMASYGQAVALAPENADVLDAAAFAFSIGGDYAEAIRLTERVMELQPTRFTSLFALGNYRKFAGDAAGALEAYRRFLDSVPALPMFAESRQLAADAIAELGRQPS